MIWFNYVRHQAWQTCIDFLETIWWEKRTNQLLRVILTSTHAAHIHIHAYIHTWTHAQTYIHICMHKHMHTCIHTSKKEPNTEEEFLKILHVWRSDYRTCRFHGEGRKRQLVNRGGNSRPFRSRGKLWCPNRPQWRRLWTSPPCWSALCIRGGEESLKRFDPAISPVKSMATFVPSTDHRICVVTLSQCSYLYWACH